MDYPQTLEELQYQLQGRWQNINGKISFNINGNELLDISGLTDFAGVKIEKSEFSIDFDKSEKKWNLFNLPLFGYKSNIIEWSENSFTVLLKNVQILAPGEESKPKNDDKIKYIRVN